MLCIDIKYVDYKMQFIKNNLYVMIHRFSIEDSFQLEMVECIEDGGIPSFEQYKSSFGYSGVLLLYIFSVIVFLYNLSLFGFTIYTFYKSKLFSKSKVVCRSFNQLIN